jgi:hypothetical protein
MRKWSVVYKTPGPYSQQFNLFVTYKLTQKARALNYSWLEKLVREEHSSLLEQFISYEDNEVLWIRLQATNSYLTTYLGLIRNQQTRKVTMMQTTVMLTTVMTMAGNIVIKLFFLCRWHSGETRWSVCPRQTVSAKSNVWERQEPTLVEPY